MCQKLSKIVKKRKSKISSFLAPKLGAVVSLAALAAGMSSMPIVKKEQQEPEIEPEIEPKIEPETEEMIKKEPEISPELDIPEKTESDEELSMLTHKLEHEMDELAKLEEEVIKAQGSKNEYKIQMKDDFIEVEKTTQKLSKRQRSMSDKHLDKLFVLNTGEETWL